MRCGTVLQKESKSVFWRWYFLGGAGWNYEKMQGLGYFYSMLPMIKKQKDEEDRKNLAKTELQFFNTNNTMAPIIMGVDCALQDETGADAADTVAALKTGMMGPTGRYRRIANSVSCDTIHNHRVNRILHGAGRKPSGVGALDILWPSAPVLHEEFLCHGL
ncbi:MAG: PTS system mannose/fructose/sorbose family transporter subunit IID [Enterocloster bolteae]